MLPGWSKGILMDCTTLHFHKGWRHAWQCGLHSFSLTACLYIPLLPSTHPATVIPSVSIPAFRPLHCALTAIVLTATCVCSGSTICLPSRVQTLAMEGVFIYHPPPVCCNHSSFLCFSSTELRTKQRQQIKKKTPTQVFFFFFFNIPGVTQRSNWTLNTAWRLWWPNWQFKYAVSLLPNKRSRNPGISEDKDKHPLAVTVKLLIVALRPPVRSGFLSMPLFFFKLGFLWFQGGFFFYLWFSLLKEHSSVLSPPQKSRRLPRLSWC